MWGYRVKEREEKKQIKEKPMFNIYEIEDTLISTEYQEDDMMKEIEVED
jgi:hypothetical protein